MRHLTTLGILCYILMINACQLQSVSTEPTQELLESACTYLWNQQAADGGWHSSTHGILRGGESLTPFILYALLQVPASVYQPSGEQLNRGLGFIRAHLDSTGIIGKTDPDILDYPNYATAHALMVLKRWGQDKDHVRIEQMSQYLIDQQFTESRGFTPDDAPYGGWGFGEEHLGKGKTGHIDLSHTRRILQALKGHRDFATAKRKARYYFNLAQKQRNEKRLHPTHVKHSHIPYDGGFFASPVTLSTNKGGIAKDSTLDVNYFRSYATATCDGLLGLLAADFLKSDEPVAAAINWLHEHPLLDYPQGIPLNDPDQWHEVMFYYHLAVRAEANAQLKIKGKWSDKIYQLLLNRQQEDGSFFNPLGGPNKEDDPLLATAFAIIALNNSQ